MEYIASELKTYSINYCTYKTSETKLSDAKTMLKKSDEYF